MAKVNFTSERIANFSCAEGQRQSFFWDAKTPGLGIRVTNKGIKSYLFETRLNGKTIRHTFGDVRTWTISDAQAYATSLKVETDKGHDPRKLMADRLAAEKAAELAAQAESEAQALKAERESVTLGGVWSVYIEDRKERWSELHLKDHQTIIQAGGVKRARSPKLTEPGPLASLAGARLVDLTSERVEEWAKLEAVSRPTRARLALRLLKACLNWCAAHKTYSEVANNKATGSKKARESLGKAKVKNDVLQREQLPAWFAAVQQIENPVISAYLQCLLLTGARREELAALKWEDVDFRWNSMKLHDKVDDFRMVPLTPYMKDLLLNLKRINDTPPNVKKLKRTDPSKPEWTPSQWVFSSRTSESGHIAEPSIAHREACAVAGVDVTLHGLRRSFASLCEWIETPSGISAQIQGHKPQGVREQNYIRRPLDLLRMWHVKIEAWILDQAGIEFNQADNQAKPVRHLALC